MEFALVSMILLMLILGMIDFGRALYTKDNLTSAAREGGRFAAVDPDPGSRVAAIKDTVIKHMSPFGGAALTASQITITFTPSSTPSLLQSVTVSISYPFEPITPIAGLIGLDPLTLKASAQFKYELGSS